MYFTRSRNRNAPWHHLVYQISDMWSACHLLSPRWKERVAGSRINESRFKKIPAAFSAAESRHHPSLREQWKVCCTCCRHVLSGRKVAPVWDMKEILNIHTLGFTLKENNKGLANSSYDYPVQKWQNYSHFGQTLTIKSNVIHRQRNEQERLWGSTFVFGGSRWGKYTRSRFPLLLPD